MTSINREPNPTNRRLALRDILTKQQTHVFASVFDPISAKLAEDTGHPAILLGGSAAALSVLGAPDIALLTLTELADLTRRICRVSGLPLIVDGDHGYGNALSVGRTIEDLEIAGAAGISIEDTVLPAAYGGTIAPQLISRAEVERKLKSAVDARIDKSLVIIGRTSAKIANDIDDVIARLLSFEQVGADSLFISGVQTKSDLEKIVAKTTLPLMLGMAGPEVADKDLMAANRVKFWVQGHGPMGLSIATLHDAYTRIQAGETVLTPPETTALINKTTGKDDYAKRAADLLDLK